MSIATPGRGIDSGSVFLFDTYNNKSYRGEPTTNLSLYLSSKVSWQTDTPSVVTQSEDTTVTYNGAPTKKIVVPSIATYWNVYGNSSTYYTQTESTVFSLSWKMKRADGAAPVLGNGYIYTNATTTAPALTVTPLEENWYLFSCLYSSTSGKLTLTGFNSTQTGTFYIAEWQVEAKNHITPFVSGSTSRSVTQGLIDLESNKYSIDLTNAAFNNKAEIIFNNSSYYTVSEIGTLTRFSVETWFRPANQPSNYGAIVSSVYPGTNFSVNFKIGFNASSEINGGTYNATDGWKTTPSTPTTLLAWHHFVFTYDGANLTLYKNGTSVGSTAYTGTPQSGGDGIRIGRRWDTTDYVSGSIDYVRIYNRALSGTEVLKSFNRVKSRYGL